MKQVIVRITEKQFTALQTAAKKRGMKVSEMIRQCLVADGIIPDDLIQHGGHKQRGAKNKKQKS